MSLDLSGTMTEAEMAMLHELLARFCNAARVRAENAGGADKVHLLSLMVDANNVRNAVGDAYAQAVGL